MDTSPDGLEQARREAQERSLVRSVMERGEPESLADALERRGQRRGRRRGPTAAEQAEAAAQRERRRAAEAKRLENFNNYLKSPEGMLYDALIKEDIDAMSEIMTTNKLSPDLMINYLEDDLNIKYTDNFRPRYLLAIAFGKRKLRSISFLIDRGATVEISVHIANSDSRYETVYYTTLYLALREGYDEIVNQILSKKLSPTFLNMYTEYHTPLKEAVYKGKIEYVKRLVQAGADINGTGDNGVTPLRVALVMKYYEIADFLKQSGAARPSLRNRYDLLGYAGVGYSTPEVFTHDLESLNWILKNYLSDFGLPSNTYAQGNPEDILFKIAHLKNKYLLEQEFFSWGYEGRWHQRINLLRPLFNNIDSSGNTALMVAIAANNITLATDLIAFGAKTAIQNNEGNTALHFAALNAKGKTGDERRAAIALINKLIDKNQALTKIKNKAGYGPGNPKLTMNAEITKLIHGRKPWLTAKNTNKPAKVGGVRHTKRRHTKRRQPFKA